MSVTSGDAAATDGGPTDATAPPEPPRRPGGRVPNLDPPTRAVCGKIPPALAAVLHLPVLAPMLLVHIGAAGVLLIETSAADLLTFAPVLVLRGFFVTGIQHRYFAHRSFRTTRLAQFLLAMGCCLNLQNGPLWWAARHRRHHRDADRPGDPHSPHQGGRLWAYCGWLFVPVPRDWGDVGDLRRYPELVWLERVWQWPGLIAAGLCWWVGGWGPLCVGFCLTAVVVFHVTFLVNTAGHLVGSRRYETPDRSRNSLLLAAVTLGDGWHNNHHRHPYAAQAGVAWWEVDGTFRVIRLLEWAGLVWDVRRVRAAVPPPAPANGRAGTGGDA